MLSLLFCTASLSIFFFFTAELWLALKNELVFQCRFWYKFATLIWLLQRYYLTYERNADHVRNLYSRLLHYVGPLLDRYDPRVHDMNWFLDHIRLYISSLQ
jgi:hypothetical protein